MASLLCCCYYIGLANILTYVLNSQEGSKSKDEVAGTKVCIVENWIQFPVVTLNSSDLIYIPADTLVDTHRHMNRLRNEKKIILAVYRTAIITILLSNH